MMAELKFPDGYMRTAGLNVVRILICPLCRRRRECICLRSASLDGKKGESTWQCTACGWEFRLRHALTVSLLEEVGDA